jgi:hypothetical protein
MTKSSSSSTTGGCGGVSPHRASLRPNLQYILSLFKEELDYLNKGWAACVSPVSGSCQDRCHLLEAFFASLAKVTLRPVCWVAISSLIQIKSGCFQQRMDLLQRLGFAMRCF